MKIGRYIPPLVLLLVSVSMVVYGVITQTFPAITIPAAGAAVIASNCSTTLVQVGTPTASTGSLEFECGPTTSAFTVTTAGASTPTYTPSPTSGFVGLYVFPAANVGPTTNCSGVNGVTGLAPSGTSMLLALGSYDYCLNYGGVAASGGSIPSFTISWS